MPESRDRLVRPVDYAAIFARRRAPSTGILIGDPEVDRNLFGSPAPVRQVATPATRGRFIGGRGGFGTPRNVRGRNLYGTPATGQENNPRTAQWSSGRGRTTGSVLPSWYPRTPLQDITAVVRVIFDSLLFNFHVPCLSLILLSCFGARNLRNRSLGSIEFSALITQYPS